jgi:CHAT domain-containing protein/Flp pilus assembly protein TadD
MAQPIANPKEKPPPELNALTVRVVQVTADNLADQGLHDKAEPLYRQIYTYWLKAAGDKDIKTAAAAFSVGFNLVNQSKNEEAQTFLDEAMRLLKQCPGDTSQELGQSYIALAVNLAELGQFEKSDTYQEAALAIFRKPGKEDNGDVMAVYSNWGHGLTLRGRFSEGESQLRKAVVLAQRLQGEGSEETATIYNNLAINLYNQGRLDEADAWLIRSLAIFKKKGGENHPDTAMIYTHRGLIASQRNRPDVAEKFHRQALAINLKASAESFGVALDCHNLAGVLEEQNRLPEAEEYYRKALAINQRLSGKRHPTTAGTINDLAYVLGREGKFEECIALYEQVLTIRTEVLGDDHPETVDSLTNLGQVRRAQRRFDDAEQLLQKAADRFEKVRIRTGRQGLDRAHYAAKHSPLIHLAALQARRGDNKSAWRNLEANLARGLFDELARPLTAEESQKERDLVWKLKKLDERIVVAEKTKAPSLPELRNQRLALTEELARFEQGLETKYGAEVGQVYDLQRIADRLPENAALVCWIDIETPMASMGALGEHWACVVRKDAQPHWIRMLGSGPNQEWVKADYKFAEDLKRLVEKEPSGESTWKALAQKVADQRLTPLLPALAATETLPAASHLIVLPSGGLAGLPIESLVAAWQSRPGPITVSYAPSGTTFAYLQEKREANPNQPHASAQLLALGNPTFRKASLANTPDGQGTELMTGKEEANPPLPNTKEEVEALAALFPKSTILVGPDASGRRLAELAATDRLREYSFLHLATHGTAEPIEAMRSRLALAEEPVDDGTGSRKTRDGQLTAEQILHTWKLNADVVSLSACQSGLGKLAGGEGYLGFSQALFIAGSRSLVLSLWKVESLATTLLMVRFYQNLLGRRADLNAPMSKVMALDEAKNWLRQLSREDANRLRTLLEEGRSIDELPAKEAGKESPDQPYEHPYYWAGFILVGDPGVVTGVASFQGGVDGDPSLEASGGLNIAWVIAGSSFALIIVVIGWALQKRRAKTTFQDTSPKR